MQAKYPDIKLAVSEYGAGANIFQHVDLREKRPKHDRDFHPEEWQVDW
jgi:beta-galactosidase